MYIDYNKMVSGAIRVGKLRFGDFTLQQNDAQDFQIVQGQNEMMGFERSTCPPTSASASASACNVANTIQNQHGDDVTIMQAEDGTFYLADECGEKLTSIVSSEQIMAMIQSEVSKSMCPAAPLAQQSPETVTYLSQADFDNGCYFIYQPGKYVLVENIVCDYHFEKQMNPDGTINAKFTGNSNSAVASIGIAVVSNDVEIDGNGYSISQSGRGATQNRIFTAIQLSGNKALASAMTVNHTNPTAQSAAAFFANNDSAFGGGGPSDAFANHFDTDIGTENVNIHDLTFGRSSHFHIHGTNNRGVTIKNCKFFEFEVAAIWLNNHASLTLENLDIVGMDKFDQSLTQLWAFRAQGTGIRGIVNASYWGIILNQQQGGVNVIFPSASGNVLTGAEGGQDRFKIGELADEKFTDGGVNKQRVGPRGPVLKNIRINELKSQMIQGYCLARKDFTGNVVPVLFDANASNTLLVGGGGHMGYRAKFPVQIEAIKDGHAWYPNVVSWLWYKNGAHAFNGDQTSLNTFLNNYKVVDENGADVAITDDASSQAALKNANLASYELRSMSGAVAYTGRDRCENVRLADRAFKWAKNAAGEYVEGKPEYTIEHTGFHEYRGKDASGNVEKNIDAHIFNVSNVYKTTGVTGAVMAMGMYSATQVKCFSTTNGQAMYYEENAAAPGAAGYRASKVLAVIGSMLANHAGDITLRRGTGDLTTEVALHAPWWDNKNSGNQTAEHLPIDFGGHQMNGVVSIHCDRVWGGLFENINIINAANLRTDNFLDDASMITNVGNMKGYTKDIETAREGTDSNEGKIGFSGSSWSLMLNDSGGNIVRNVNSLNMLARNGASFAIHMAFGSRGNIVEDCHVLSNTGGEMWGFVTDKGSIGNLFRRCTAQDIVGAAAAGGFVVRGHGNILEDCKALGVKVIAQANPPKSFDALPAFRKVSAGFLLDFGGADEFEYQSRYRGSNTLRNCEANGVLVIGEHQVDRNAEIIYRKKKYLEAGSELDDIIAFENAAIDKAKTVTAAGFMEVAQANNFYDNCTSRYIRHWQDEAPKKAASFKGGALVETNEPPIMTDKSGDVASYTDATMVSTPWDMTI